ncbi:MAG: hypothetical protein N0C91_13090, partial [Candidatus Thiodiazotropha endolucinida]|nr:hypothetical protein [Candidatus Thiodiazotropha taylori]MCW4288637.1 hypothetical protein [Candidatus Thiodiazotropha endolucinida]
MMEIAVYRASLLRLLPEVLRQKRLFSTAGEFENLFSQLFCPLRYYGYTNTLQILLRKHTFLNLLEHFTTKKGVKFTIKTRMQSMARHRKSPHFFRRDLVPKKKKKNNPSHKAPSSP